MANGLRPGPLALVGGAEFMPGNEPHDERLIAAAVALGGDRPAFVIATAAARHDPDAAVDTARGWFRELGLEVEELPLRRRSQAKDVAIAAFAATGRFFYLCGGDPGVVPQVLAGTRVWEAITTAWRGGAGLAGSSAGAMALGEWTLIRARMPGDAKREARAALAVVPSVAVLPHYSDFGQRWLPSARAAVPATATLVGIDERTAALWSDGVWHACGRGGVTVHGSGEAVRAEAGTDMQLPIPQATGAGPG